MAYVEGGQIIIKYIPSVAFGKDWKAGKNREVNEQLLKKYSMLAQEQFKVNIGEKEEVKQEGKFLIWTLKLN